MGTTIMSVIAVVVVAVLLIPHWTAGIFSLPLVCVLYIDLLGALQVRLDFVIMPNQTGFEPSHHVIHVAILLVGRHPCQVSCRHCGAESLCCIMLGLWLTNLHFFVFEQCCFIHWSFNVDWASRGFCHACFAAILRGEGN